MRIFVVFLLLLAMAFPLQAAQLDSVNIEIDPVVQWEYITNPPSYRQFFVDILLPDVTLSPADTLNINVHFTDNKMLQVTHDPYQIGFYFTLANAEASGPPFYESDGLCELNFLNYYDLPSPQITCYPNVDSAPNPSVTRSTSFFGNVENGACLGDFSLIFTMPTKLLNPPEPIEAIKTTTFTNNSIKLFARDAGSPSEYPFVPALQVVPESATLLLFGLGGLVLRRKR